MAAVSGTMSIDAQPSGLYQTLNRHDGIRLLRLQPASDPSAPLRCQLYCTALSTYRDEIVDHYTAISYVWGDPNDTHEIMVNGYLLQVTSNLETALRDLRDKISIRVLWIDAICINQENLNERASQVGLMSKIYAMALHTVIYLGPADPNSANPLTLLQTLSKNLTSATAAKETRSIESPKVPKLPRSTDSVSTLSNIAVVGSDDSDQSFRAKWSSSGRAKPHTLNTISTRHFLNGAKASFVPSNVSFANILERPWFTRVWVFQELIFSKDPWVQLGSTARIRWKEFCNSPGLTYAMEDQLSREATRGYHLLQGMNNARIRHDTISKPLLIELLDERRALGVSDPRDMLFAHVDFSHEGRSDSRLQVDYRRSIERVYTGIASYFLDRQDVGYNILSYVGDHTSGGRCPNLPSWVPDWTVPDVIPHRIQQQYGGIPESITKTSPSLVLKNGTILAGRGLSVGIITNLGEIMGLPLPSIDRAIEIEKTTRYCERKDRDYNKYLNYVDKIRNTVVDDHKKSIFSKKEKSQAVESSKAAYDRFVKYYRGKLLSLHQRRLKLYQDKYNYWEQMLGSELLPPREFDLEELIECPGFDEVFGSIPPTNKLNFASESVIAHLVFACCKSTAPSLVAGRRLAKLDGGLLALVPPSAKLGDMICFFEHTLISAFEFHEVPFLLRPYKFEGHEELDAIVLSAERGILDQKSFRRLSVRKLDPESVINKRVLFSETDRGSNNSALHATPESESGRESPLLREGRNHRRLVKHFTFVGEAFVDGQMLGKGRRMRYHNSEEIVFALH